jgi:hypothetical protein
MLSAEPKHYCRTSLRLHSTYSNCDSSRSATMPALQQLLRGYRSCQMISHMQSPPAHALRCLPGVAAVGHSSQQASQCRTSRACAAAGSPAGGQHSLHSSCSSSGRHCLPFQHTQQQWGGRMGNSKQPSTPGQLVCHASSQPQDSTPQPSGSNTVRMYPSTSTRARWFLVQVLLRHDHSALQSIHPSSPLTCPSVCCRC